MLFFSQISIRQKLMRLTVASAGIALVFASLAFFAYEVFAYRRHLVREISLIADMVETSSLAALTFEDAEQAEAALQTMQVNPDIVSAFLFSDSGRCLAGYRKNGAPDTPIPTALGPDRMEISGWRARRVQTLRLQGRKVGTLYLTADMGGLKRQFLWAAASVALIAMLSLTLVLLLFKRLQKGLEAPLVKLAATARAVARGHNYSLRVRPQGDDELGLLMADFNEMLAGIQHRDEELRHYRAHLEDMVRTRTEQLERDMEERKSLEKQFFRSQRLDSGWTASGPWPGAWPTT